MRRRGHVYSQQLPLRKSPLAATVVEPIGEMHGERPPTLPELLMRCSRSQNNAEGPVLHIYYGEANSYSGLMRGTLIATERRMWGWRIIRPSQSRCCLETNRG